MTLDIFLQWLTPCLLGVISYFIVRMIDRFDKLEKAFYKFKLESVKHEGDEQTNTKLVELQIKQTQIKVDDLNENLEKYKEEIVTFEKLMRKSMTMMEAFNRKTTYYDSEIKRIQEHIFMNGK